MIWLAGHGLELPATTRRAHPNRQTADRRDGGTGGMCAQRQQTPVHRSCERALRVPCRRHSPLHISGFRHWQMGKGSSVAPSPLPTTRAACSHPNSQQRTRACLSEPLRLSSRPFDVRVRAPLRAAVAWWRSSLPASAARRARRRCCAHHPPRMPNHRRVASSVACSVACWFRTMGRWRWRSDRVRRQ